MKNMGGNYNQQELYHLLQNMTPEEQQRFLYQQQMMQMQYQDQPRNDDSSYRLNPAQQMIPEYSYRSGNDYEHTPNSNISIDK